MPQSSQPHAYIPQKFPRLQQSKPVFAQVKAPLPTHTPKPAQIPSSEEWLNDTRIGVGVQWRSTPLKAVDSAIAKCELDLAPINIWALKHAFDAWKRSKGGDWYNSKRNGNEWLPRVLDLYLENWAANQPRVQFTREEYQALRVIAKERQQTLNRLFEGKRVTFRCTRKTAKQGAINALKSLKEELQRVPKTLDLLVRNPHPQNFDENFQREGQRYREHFHNEFWKTIESFFTLKGVIGAGSMGNDAFKTGSFLAKEVLINVTPIVTQSRMFYALTLEMLRLARLKRYELSIGEARYCIDNGTPERAFEGLRRCINMNLGIQAGVAACSGAALVSSLLGIIPGGVFPAGIATTSINVLAKTLGYLCDFGAEIRATQAVNKILRSGKIDWRIFETYPLMGCYVLRCASLSDLIPLDCFGKPGWMEHINSMKEKAFDEIYDIAGQLIDASHFEIVGMPKRRPGNAGFNFFEPRKAALTGLSSGRRFVGHFDPRGTGAD